MPRPDRSAGAANAACHRDRTGPVHPPRSTDRDGGGRDPSRDTNFHTTQAFTRAELDSRAFDIDPKTGRVKEMDKAKAPPAKRPRKPRR